MRAFLWFPRSFLKFSGGFLVVFWSFLGFSGVFWGFLGNEAQEHPLKNAIHPINKAVNLKTSHILHVFQATAARYHTSPGAGGQSAACCRWGASAAWAAWALPASAGRLLRGCHRRGERRQGDEHPESRFPEFLGWTSWEAPNWIE